MCINAHGSPPPEIGTADLVIPGLAEDTSITKIGIYRAWIFAKCAKKKKSNGSEGTKELGASIFPIYIYVYTVYVYIYMY